MFKTESSIQAKKKWFGLGRMVSAEINVSGDDPSSVLPIKEITLTLLREFPELRQAFAVYEGPRDKKTIQNFRGRPFSTITPQRQQSESSSIEELLLLSGEKATVDSEDKNNQNTEKFLYSLLTKFESFEKRVINYELSTREVLPTSYRPCNLEKLEEALSDQTINLTNVRMGFEKFKPRFLSTYTGVIPTIYGYFYLELTPTSVKISAQQGNCEKAQSLPFEAEGYIQAVTATLKKLLGDLIS